jgi:nucleoside-diphosphate-sugar epimerase
MGPGRFQEYIVRKPVVLITGAAGEIGHGLIRRLAENNGDASIITLDLQSLDKAMRPYVVRHYIGSILDQSMLESILAEYKINTIFHLAALLSTRSEFTPVTAQQVNVDGTLRLLEFAQDEGRSHGETVVFFYPSSIAAYGLPDLDTKSDAGKVREDQFNEPITMYGCNKLACEHLGRYYMHYYKQLDAEPQAGRIDFRSLRFPGLISAETIPSGGTSDYAPEMIHAAAQKAPYACFVRPDTRIPFMTMTDAVDAMLQYAMADREHLTRLVYNLAAFSPTAEEIHAQVLRSFPDAKVSFEVDAKRQKIVDSWPADVDDSAARNDWSLAPRHDLASAFEEVLVPAMKERYR